MGFEDELADIVRKQAENGEQIYTAETLQSALAILKDEDSIGYIVFANPEGKNGLIAIGGIDSLSYSHRLADRLINEVTFGCEHDV